MGEGGEMSISGGDERRGTTCTHDLHSTTGGELDSGAPHPRAQPIRPPHKTSPPAPPPHQSPSLPHQPKAQRAHASDAHGRMAAGVRGGARGLKASRRCLRSRTWERAYHTYP